MTQSTRLARVEAGLPPDGAAAPSIPGEVVSATRARPWLRSHHTWFWTLSIVVCLAGYADVVFGGRTFIPIGRAQALYEEPPFAAGYRGKVWGRAEHDPGAQAWQMHPWAYAERRALAEWSLPLWNRHDGLGHPLLANGLTATLNPLHALVLLDPDSPWLWDLHFLALRFLAALFGCYLLSRLGVRKELSLLGAPFGAFNGHFTLFVNRADLEVFALMPAVLYFTVRLRQAPRAGNAIALALAIVFCLNAGHPEPACAALLTCGLFAVALIPWPAGRDWRRFLLHYGAAIALAVLLSAPYWLPFLVQTRAAAHLHPAGTADGSLPPVAVLQWLAPNAFSLGQKPYFYDSTWPCFGYLGAAMSFFALLALLEPLALRKAAKPALWLVGPILLALKIYGAPLMGWFGKLPLIEQMGMYYFEFPVLYCLGIFGIAAFARLDSAPARVRTLLPALAGILLLGAVTLAPLYLRWIHVTLSPSWWIQLFRYVPALLGAWILSWAILSERVAPRRRTQASLLLVFLLGLELGTYRTPLSERGNPTASAPVIRWLKARQREEQPFRVMGLGGELMPNFASAYGLDDVRICDALLRPEYVRFIQRFLQKEFIWGWFFTAQPELGFDPQNPILDWLNVRYLLAGSEGVAGPGSALHRALLGPQENAARGPLYLIDGEPLRVFEQNPNAERSVRGRIPERYPILAFALAQHPLVWEKPSGGTTYDLAVSASGSEPISVFSRTIDPKRDPAQRHWIWSRVDLRRWAGQDVLLTLRSRSLDIRDGRGGWADLHFESPDGERQSADGAPRRPVVYRDAEMRGGRVFENVSAWPRIFTVGSPFIEPDQERVLDRIELLKGKDGPFAVVADDFPAAEWNELCRREGCDSARPHHGSTTNVRYSTNGLSFSVENDKPAVLVISDSFAPGWHATVDGAERRIFRANYLFRGVLLPPGRHEVRLQYWPTEWTAAFVLCGSGILAALAFVLFSRRRPATLLEPP